MVDKDIYRVVHTRTQKVVNNSPVFYYPHEAERYIDKFIGQSPYVTIKKVRDKNER